MLYVPKIVWSQVSPVNRRQLLTITCAWRKFQFLLNQAKGGRWAMILVDVVLVRDTAVVTAICAEVGNGNLQVCNGCGDIEELIAGVLIIDDAEEAWVLCGACIRKLPFGGTVV